MELKEIKIELRKLSELVGDWSEQRPVAPLERDLVLEKLRAVYEALRFGPEVSGDRIKAYIPVAAGPSAPAVAVRPRRRAASESEDSDIEMVDLSEMFDEPAAPETSEPQAVSPRDLGPDTSADPDDEGPEIIEFVPEPAPVPHSQPAPSPQPVPQPEPVRRPEPKPHSRPATPAPQEPAAEAPAAKAFAAPPAAAARPAPELSQEEFLPEEPQPVQEPQPEEKTLAGEPQSLFGPDEEALRHRHKQRVIMSLYDGAPKPAEPAATNQAANQAVNQAAHKHPEPDGPVSAAPVSGRADVSGRVDTSDRTDADGFRADDSEIVLLDAFSEQPAGAVPEPEEEFDGPEILELDDEPEPAPAAKHAPPVSRRPAAPAAPAAEPAASQVLGDVINHDVRTLGETIAAAPGKTFAAPIADLRQAIGINDKFLMIRDLFGGNSVLFDATITALNSQQSLDDCMIYIAEHFAWNPDSESARLIMELLERKFA